MCTAIRFTDKNGNMFWGRNLDWECGYGQHVVAAPAAWNYEWVYGGERPRKHDIIGMAIIVEDDQKQDVPLFFDCANDAGLACGGLNFPGDGFCKFEEKPVDGKVNVAAYEFPLWITSNFATVDEVESALIDEKGDSKIAIVGKAPTEELGIGELHYHIADSNRSIVVEYKADGLHLYHDELDVLANQPDFFWHAENVRNYMSLTSEVPADVNWREKKLHAFGSGFGMNALPGGFSSPSRFVRAAYLNSHYPDKETEEENVSRLFHTLAGVAMIDGGAKMSDGNYEKTLYTSGYSSATKTYYFNDYDNPSLRSISMDELLSGADGRTLIESNVR